MYYDNAATTKPLMDVVDAINKVIIDNYGNPSSIYNTGIKAHKMLEEARQTIAEILRVKPHEIIFTSGGSESNNLAIKGFLFFHPSYAGITTRIEHKSVINSFKFMENHTEIPVYYLDVDEYGFINYEQLESYIEDYQRKGLKPFVSIQYANSEIGTIQDIERVAKIVHDANGILHCDAVQMFGTSIVQPKKIGIDLMSVSGHKFGATKGVGFLYKREDINIEPLIHGGNQEKGLRAGTECTPLIAGLAVALSNLKEKQKFGITNSRNYLIRKLTTEIEDCRINGDLENRLPGNISLSIKNIDGEALLLLLNMKGIEISNGSACNTGSLEPSAVLEAIKTPTEYINGTIRITFDRPLGVTETNTIVRKIKECVDYMREAQG